MNMAFDLLNKQVVPDRDMSSTKIPAHIDGFIDLEVLVNIHKYLGASENNDDVDLAVWVKDNYLQEPLAESSRPIRDSEGFANLDKAYRRVRQLTGKAQDKWPFFDRNWKEMSSTLVKQAVLGNAVVSRSVVDKDDEFRELQTNNGFDRQHEQTSRILKLPVKFGSSTYDADLSQELNSPQPLKFSVADREETEQQAQRQASESKSLTMSNAASKSTVLDESLGTPTLNETLDSSMSSLDDVRDAGAVKVRGPHGRFMNKSKPSPIPTRDPNPKSSVERRTTASDDESKERASSHEASVQTQKKKNGIARRLSSVSDDNAIQSNNALLTDMQRMSTVFNAFPASAVLAAEAEAVPSNLDRLPPGLVSKKRKSEGDAQSDGLKRARGSRGGVLGRPRKSETLEERSQVDAGQSLEVEQVLLKPEPPAKSVARRSHRKPAPSAVDPSTAWDHTEDLLLNNTDQEQPAGNDNHTPIKGISSSSRNHRTSKTLPSLDKKTKHATSEPLNGTPVSTAKNLALKEKKTPTSSKQKKRVSFSPQDNKVEFFARISTSAGVQELHLSEQDLTSEVDLIKRYAAWQRSGNASVTFEVFKNIVMFTR